jgi:hypothetical protein
LLDLNGLSKAIFKNKIIKEIYYEVFIILDYCNIDSCFFVVACEFLLVVAESNEDSAWQQRTATT